MSCFASTPRVPFGDFYINIVGSPANRTGIGHAAFPPHKMYYCGRRRSAMRFANRMASCDFLCFCPVVTRVPLFICRGGCKAEHM